MREKTLIMNKEKNDKSPGWTLVESITGKNLFIN